MFLCFWSHHSNLCLHLPGAFFPVSLCVLFCLLQRHLELGLTLIWHDFILILTFAVSATTLVRACSVASVMSDSLRLHGLQPTRLFCPWDSPGKNAGADCCAHLRGSSRPRYRTCVSCIADRFFTTEPLGNLKRLLLSHIVTF